MVLFGFSEVHDFSVSSVNLYSVSCWCDKQLPKATLGKSLFHLYIAYSPSWREARAGTEVEAMGKCCLYGFAQPAL